MAEFKAYRLMQGEPAPEGRFVAMRDDELSPGDVLIRVAYSSVNFKDALAAAGRNAIVRQYPRIGGIDLVGTVESSGDSALKTGTEVVVHGFGIGVDHDGGHAQYARVPAEWVLPRETFGPGKRPLDKAVWAGGVDSVGGETLAALIRAMQQNGVVAAFGNAAGPELPTTVLPFILRGVRLLGINANSPMPLRTRIWNRIATDLRPRHLEHIRQVIPFGKLPDALAQVLAGGARGRFVVDMTAS